MRLVLAYGNPLRGDDAVGWRLAEALRGSPETEVVCVHQLVPELACRVSGAAGVLFLDAGVGEPGTISVHHVRADPGGADVGHVLGPSTLLYLSRTFFGGSPEAVLLTVAGRDFSFGAGLSGPVAEALGEAERRAREALGRLPVGSGAVAPVAK